MNAQTKKKIAVLGGGISSLTAVLDLTKDPNWKERYDITLYQMGWRLGGKGASGRNPNEAMRIEEHGLHLWFGCYHNAFALMRAVYEENNRSLDMPLATLDQAFEPSTFVALHEELNGQSHMWPLEFPFDENIPGTRNEVPTVWTFVVRMIKKLIEKYFEYFLVNTFRPSPNKSEAEAAFIRELNDGMLNHIKKYSKIFGLPLDELSPHAFIEFIEKFLYSQRQKKDFSVLLMVIEEMQTWLWDKIQYRVEEMDNIRRMWILFDLTMATVKGVVHDKLYIRGLDAINDKDYREWISAYCLTPKMTAWSAPIQAMYSLIFCGKDKFTFEAGTCLRCIFRVALDYNGAFYYRMQAGMGDVVFGPIYEVLKKRGVQFKFFHKVQNLRLSSDKTQVASIKIARQVTLKQEEYDPLFDVKGLKCWPSIPLYDQLEEGEELKTRHIDLESSWSDWENVATFDLTLGKDFDEIILGISIGALPYICSELIEANPAWQKMIDQVSTTPTQALQVWLKPDITGLGWGHHKQGKPLIGNFEGRYDTYADLTNIVHREQWPDGEVPGHLAYLCGQLDHVEDGTAKEDPKYPAVHLQVAKDNAVKFLNALSWRMWPSSRNGSPDHINWNLLSDLNQNEGEHRLQGQYIRANVEPTELYVLAEKGNSQYRLKTDASGFSNVYLTGDWIDNGFNAGCIEATVISGLQAARAVRGGAERIIGESDLVSMEPEFKVEEKEKLFPYSTPEVIVRLKKLYNFGRSFTLKSF